MSSGMVLMLPWPWLHHLLSPKDPYGASMENEKSPSSNRWLLQSLIYEGFPLILRRPREMKYLDFKKEYPVLLGITHLFDRSMPNGLPMPDYNKTLFEFDNFLVNCFDSSNGGKIVLVETFGHERSYYFYVSQGGAWDDVVRDLKKRFPDQKIEIFSKNDPEWKFIEDYASEFF